MNQNIQNPYIGKEFFKRLERCYVGNSDSLFSVLGNSNMEKPYIVLLIGKNPAKRKMPEGCNMTVNEFASFNFDLLKKVIKGNRPTMVIAESFFSFQKLNDQDEILICKNKKGKKLLLQGGCNGSLLLGVCHSSNKYHYGISDKDWKLVSNKLIKIFNVTLINYSPILVGKI